MYSLLILVDQNYCPDVTMIFASVNMKLESGLLKRWLGATNYLECIDGFSWNVSGWDTNTHKLNFTCEANSSVGFWKYMYNEADIPACIGISLAFRQDFLGRCTP